MVTLSLFLVLAQAAAWSSGRPPECTSESGRGANVWERAKSPELRRYCDLVASASSKLAGTSAMALAALDAARKADEALPGHAAPHVLQARALAALGKFDDALGAMRDAKTRDARALDDPAALVVWARSLARTGHADEAADAYRALLPRASALPASDRAAATVEAGLVAMSRGPAGLDEAAASLREGLRAGQDESQAVAALALALALDRRGDGDESRALLRERIHGDPRNATGTARARELLAVAPAEASAVVALALEPTDAAGARDAWQKYLEASPGSPWAAHARTHLAAVSPKRRPR